MRAQVKQVLEIIEGVRNRWGHKMPRETVEQIRIEVVHEIAKNRGIAFQTVEDKARRKFEPDLISMSQFDSLLEQYIVARSAKLRNILLKHAASSDEERAIKDVLPIDKEIAEDAIQQHAVDDNTISSDRHDSETISVRSKKTDRTVYFEKSFGTNLEEAKEKYGEETVFELFKAMAIIKCQAAVRGVLNDPTATKEEAIQVGIAYDPSLSRQVRRNQDPLTALAGMVKSGELTMDQLKRMLEDRLKTA
jgi:hypothetical protein